MPHVISAFSTFRVQNVIPNGCWRVTAITSKKPSAWKGHRKLSAVRLPWWVDTMVNLSGFYMVVVFLWRFRKHRGKNFITRAFFTLCHAQCTKRKWGYSWSNRVLCEAKAICGTTSLRVAVLALFYASVKRGTKTKEIEKKTTTWRNEIKPQIRQKLTQFVPRMFGSLFLCLILVFLLRTNKGNFPYKGYKTRLSIEGKVGCWVCAACG